MYLWDRDPVVGFRDRQESASEGESCNNFLLLGIPFYIAQSSPIFPSPSPLGASQVSSLFLRALLEFLGFDWLRLRPRVINCALCGTITISHKYKSKKSTQTHTDT